MSKIALIVDEMKRVYDGEAWHGPALREILQGVTAAQAAARPLAGAHSIWELVLHISAWEDVFRRRMSGEAIEEPEEGDFPPVRDTRASSWQSALGKLYSGHELFVQAVSALPESNLDRKAVGREYSTGFMLQMAIRHAVYHSGQIAMLKKA